MNDTTDLILARYDRLPPAEQERFRGYLAELLCTQESPSASACSQG